MNRYLVGLIIFATLLCTCMCFQGLGNDKVKHLLRGESNLQYMKKLGLFNKHNPHSRSNIDPNSNFLNNRRRISKEDLKHLKHERSNENNANPWNLFGVNPFMNAKNSKRVPNALQHVGSFDKFHVIVTWKNEIKSNSMDGNILSENAQSCTLSFTELAKLLDNEQVEHFDPIFKFSLPQFSFMFPKKEDIPTMSSFSKSFRPSEYNQRTHAERVYTFTGNTNEEFVFLKILVEGQQNLELLSQVLDMFKVNSPNSITEITRISSQGFVIAISKKDSLVLSYEIAKIPFVFWIEILPKNELYNKWAKGITQSGTALQNTLTVKGLTGRGQIIGVGDTGLDANSCFFYDPNHPVPFTNTTKAMPSQHRKIVSYWSFMDGIAEDDAHGTHVCGTIASQAIALNGSSASPLSEFDGIASEAKIVFTDLNCMNPDGCTCKDTPNGFPCSPYSCRPIPGAMMVPYSLSQDYFPFSYNMGARIHSNSWGGGSFMGYSTSSMDIDKFAWEHKDFLILFAAGNSGRTEGYSSISTTADSKNIVTVGASMSTKESSVFALSEVKDFDSIAVSYAKYLMDKYECPYEWNVTQSASCDKFSQKRTELCEMLRSVKSEKDCCSKNWSFCSSDVYFETCGCMFENMGSICCRFCSVFDAGYYGSSQENMAYYSSLGPASDGRIKPDVVAPGFYLTSARAHNTLTSPMTCSMDSPLSYNLMEASGTSMACPLVSANAALIRQYYSEGWYPNGRNESSNGFNPSSALVKASLINGAIPLKGSLISDYDINLIHDDTGVGKSFFLRSKFVEGFGRVQLDRTLIMGDSLRNLLIGRVSNLYSNYSVLEEFGDPIISSTKEMHTYCIIPKESNRNMTDLKITLVWTDYPSNPSRNKHLVNNLDLGVQVGNDIFFGNTEKNSFERDSINNVEQVQIETITNNPRIIINIESSYIFQPQSYALVITGENIQFDKNCTVVDQNSFLKATRGEGSKIIIIREVEVIVKNETVYVVPAIDPIFPNPKNPKNETENASSQYATPTILGLVLIVLSALFF